MVIGVGEFSMIDGTHRVRVSPVRPRAGNGGKVEFWAGGDNQVVVADRVAVILMHGFGFRVEPGDAGMDKVDAFALQIRLNRKGDFVTGTPTNGHPWVRGSELEIVGGVDGGDLV